MVKKRVLVIALFDLTPLYFQISKILDDEVEFFWISTHDKYFQWLLDAGVDPKNIEHLAFDKNIVPDSERILDKITLVEARCDITLNQAIMMDRFLMEEIEGDTHPFVLETFDRVDSFISKVGPQAVFFEPTNITDMVTYMLATYYGIEVYYPADLRFPANRVGFFKGYHQYRLASGYLKRSDCPSGGQALIESFRSEFAVPYSYDTLNSRNKFDLMSLIGKIVRNVPSLLQRSELVKLTDYNLKKRFIEYFLFKSRSFYLRKFLQGKQLQAIEGKVAYYPLHVQPESSIDVLGSYFSEQLKFIKDIRRTLPVDYTLVIKEHPNFVGSKPIGFFKSLEKLPGTCLVPYTEPASDIIKRSDLVITISGTSAYQAGLLGIPAVTFAPMFFDGLSTVKNCNSMKDLADFMQEISAGLQQDIQHDVEYIDALLRDSFEGYWTDVAFDEAVLQTDNLNKLSNAMLAVLNKNP